MSPAAKCSTSSPPYPYAKKNGTTVWRVRFRDGYGKQTCKT